MPGNGNGNPVNNCWSQVLNKYGYGNFVGRWLEIIHAVYSENFF